MRITDELREFMRGADGYELWCPRHKAELLAIADRIDEKHKRAIGYVDDRDPETMAENGWVRLPTDADGEYIHVGDVMEGYGKTIEVVELRYGCSGWVLISRDGNGYADTFAFTHHHAPTVEDVLREFAEKMNENMGMYTGEAIDADEWRQADSKTIAEYAKKLQLREA